jgi:hypothetical protein
MINIHIRVRSPGFEKLHTIFLKTDVDTDSERKLSVSFTTLPRRYGKKAAVAWPENPLTGRPRPAGVQSVEAHKAQICLGHQVLV